MTFTEELWSENKPLFEATLALPFNRDLAKGILSEDQFQHYIIQDAHYLGGFARALSLLSAKGPTSDHVVHFARAAETAIIVERGLHAAFFDQFGVSQETFETTPRTAACDHYVSFLLAQTALQSFEVGLASVLPCFWIYREVGLAIHAKAAPNNPYQSWIDTYAGEDFSKAVDEVLVITNDAGKASPTVKASMKSAYAASARLEWMFWDSAYYLRDWPI